MLAAGRTAIQVTSQPAVEPVSLTDAKTYLRVTGTDEDTLITGFIAAARALVETYLGRKLITQTLKYTLDSIPRVRGRRSDDWDGYMEGHIGDLEPLSERITLPYPPLQSVSSVVTYGLDNTSATFASSNYNANLATNAIYLNSGSIWPVNLRSGAAMEITYVVGYGAAAANVPPAILQAVMQVISAFYNNRECPDMPASAAALIQAYRVMPGVDYAF